MNYDKAPSRSKSKSLNIDTVTPLILDYYQRFGQNRDLEQYFQSRTASSASSCIQPDADFATARCLISEGDHSHCQRKELELQSKSLNIGEKYKPSIKFKSLQFDPSVQTSEDKMEYNKEYSNLLDHSVPSSYIDSARRSTRSDNSTPKQSPETDEVHPDSPVAKAVSPGSSVTRKLEWDSLADVGYANAEHGRNTDKPLSAIERMALDSQYKSDPKKMQPKEKTYFGLNDVKIGNPTAHSTPITETVEQKEAKKEKSPLQSPSENVEPKQSDERPILNEVRNSGSYKVTCESNDVSMNWNVGIAKNFCLKTPKGETRYSESHEIKFDPKVYNAADRQMYNLILNKTTTDDSATIKSTEPSKSTLTTDAVHNKEIQTSHRHSVSASAQTLESSANNLNADILKTASSPVALSVAKKKSRLKLQSAKKKMSYTAAFKRMINLYPNTNKDSMDSYQSVEEPKLDEKQYLTIESSSNNNKDGESIVSRAESFEYMPGHLYQKTDKKTQIQESRSIPESSQRVTTTESADPTSSSHSKDTEDIVKVLEASTSLSRDLNSSIDLLGKLINVRQKDPDTKKKLIKKIVKILVKTDFPEDESNIPVSGSDKGESTSEENNQKLVHEECKTDNNEKSNSKSFKLLKTVKSAPISLTYSDYLEAKAQTERAKQADGDSKIISDSSSKNPQLEGALNKVNVTEIPINVTTANSSQPSDVPSLQKDTNKVKSQELYKKYLIAKQQEEKELQRKLIKKSLNQKRLEMQQKNNDSSDKSDHTKLSDNANDTQRQLTKINQEILHLTVMKLKLENRHKPFNINNIESLLKPDNINYRPNPDIHGRGDGKDADFDRQNVLVYYGTTSPDSRSITPRVPPLNFRNSSGSNTSNNMEEVNSYAETYVKSDVIRGRVHETSSTSPHYNQPTCSKYIDSASSNQQDMTTRDPDTKLKYFNEEKSTCKENLKTPQHHFVDPRECPKEPSAPVRSLDMKKLCRNCRTKQSECTRCDEAVTCKKPNLGETNNSMLNYNDQRIQSNTSPRISKQLTSKNVRSTLPKTHDDNFRGVSQFVENELMHGRSQPPSNPHKSNEHPAPPKTHNDYFRGVSQFVDNELSHGGSHPHAKSHKLNEPSAQTKTRNNFNPIAEYVNHDRTNQNLHQKSHKEPPILKYEDPCHSQMATDHLEFDLMAEYVKRRLPPPLKPPPLTIEDADRRMYSDDFYTLKQHKFSRTKDHHGSKRSSKHPLKKSAMIQTDDDFQPALNFVEETQLKIYPKLTQGNNDINKLVDQAINKHAKDSLGYSQVTNKPSTLTKDHGPRTSKLERPKDVHIKYDNIATKSSQPTSSNQVDHRNLDPYSKSRMLHQFDQNESELTESSHCITSICSSLSGPLICSCCRSNLISPDPTTKCTAEVKPGIKEELNKLDRIFDKYQKCKVMQCFMKEYDELISKYKLMKKLNLEKQNKDQGLQKEFDKSKDSSSGIPKTPKAFQGFVCPPKHHLSKTKTGKQPLKKSTESIHKRQELNQSRGQYENSTDNEMDSSKTYTEVRGIRRDTTEFKHVDKPPTNSKHCYKNSANIISEIPSARPCPHTTFRNKSETQGRTKTDQPSIIQITPEAREIKYSTQSIAIPNEQEQDEPCTTCRTENKTNRKDSIAVNSARIKTWTDTNTSPIGTLTKNSADEVSSLEVEKLHPKCKNNTEEYIRKAGRAYSKNYDISNYDLQKISDTIRNKPQVPTPEIYLPHTVPKPKRNIVNVANSRPLTLPIGRRRQTNFNEYQYSFKDKNERKNVKETFVADGEILCECKRNILRSGQDTCIECVKNKKLTVSKMINQERLADRGVRPKPIAYNLIIEASDSIMEEPVQNKRLSLEEVIVKVSKSKCKQKKGSKNAEGALHLQDYENNYDTEEKGSTDEQIKEFSDLNSDGDSCLSSVSSRSVKSNMENEVPEREHKKYNMTLKEYLQRKRPDFVQDANQRRECLRKIHNIRQQREAEQRRLLSLGVNNLPNLKQISSDDLMSIAREHGISLPKDNLRVFSSSDMVKYTTRQYKKLPEVRNKKVDNKKREYKKTNQLMAELFAKKLKEKTLKGVVNISPSKKVFSIIL